jgi:hypothetical protein
MIIYSKNSENNNDRSFYPSMSFDWLGTRVYVIGPDVVLQQLIKSFVLALGAARFDADVSRKLYLEIPGQYAILLVKSDSIKVVTDPYGIVKIYGFMKGEELVVVDDIMELKEEVFTLDKEAIKYFFLNNFTPSKHTFFKEVFKFEPCSIYSSQTGPKLEGKIYAQIEKEPLEGKEFLDKFYNTISDSLKFYQKNYDKSCLFLSGGIDSSFLFRFLCGKNSDKEWFELMVGKMEGMGQTSKIDNDLDVEFSQRLSAEEDKALTVVTYNYGERETTKDFVFLRDHLFTEYAPAMGYLGYSRYVDSDRIILNGQNADSVLSFGSQGAPAFQRKKITGLNGLFSRYFNFIGHGSPGKISARAARLLRSVYYKKSYPNAQIEFSDRNYFIGIGLHPKNQYVFEKDPVFNTIVDAGSLLNWFDNQYVKPLQKSYPSNSQHALSMLLYQKTYMQGSANRSTVLSALTQGKKIFLPYTTLALFELMCNLEADLNYAYQGKYPNIVIGRDRIGLPEYILKRSDPVDCDSTEILFITLLKNKEFRSFLTDNLEKSDWSLYKNILADEIIQKFQNFEKAIDPHDLPTFMRFIWIDSLLRKFKVS